MARLRYLDWLGDSSRRAARSEADARLIYAKAELLQLRIAEKCRDLVHHLAEMEDTGNSQARAVVSTPIFLCVMLGAAPAIRVGPAEAFPGVA